MSYSTEGNSPKNDSFPQFGLTYDNGFVTVCSTKSSNSTTVITVITKLFIIKFEVQALGRVKVTVNKYGTVEQELLKSLDENSQKFLQYLDSLTTQRATETLTLIEEIDRLIGTLPPSQEKGDFIASITGMVNRKIEEAKDMEGKPLSLKKKQKVKEGNSWLKEMQRTHPPQQGMVR